MDYIREQKQLGCFWYFGLPFQIISPPPLFPPLSFTSPRKRLNSLTVAFEFVLAFVTKLWLNTKIMVGTVRRKSDVSWSHPRVYPNCKQSTFLYQFFFPTVTLWTYLSNCNWAAICGSSDFYDRKWNLNTTIWGVYFLDGTLLLISSSDCIADRCGY